MNSSIRGLAAAPLALLLTFAISSGAHAQAVYVTPAPVVSYSYSPAVSYYTPAVSYYAAPAVSYYTPAVSYYAAPAVSYAAPAVSYYTPATSYYYTPAVSYYAPSSAVTTTYRYGILPRRQVTVTNYYTPAYYLP